MRKTIFAKIKKAKAEAKTKKTTDSYRPADDDGEKVSESLFYRIFVKTAYRLLQKPLTVFQLLKKSIEQLEKYDSIRELAEDTKERFGIITRMVRAYLKGEYRGISRKNVALSLAAILYFLSPFDLIPDFLVGGLLDDFALLTWLYNNLKGELEEFQTWEEGENLIRIPIQVIEEEDSSK
jgi:uncharacterized membrane protein YkvA (DUF1232 family)